MSKINQLKEQRAAISAELTKILKDTGDNQFSDEATLRLDELNKSYADVTGQLETETRKETALANIARGEQENYQKVAKIAGGKFLNQGPRAECRALAGWLKHHAGVKTSIPMDDVEPFHDIYKKEITLKLPGEFDKRSLLAETRTGTINISAGSQGDYLVPQNVVGSEVERFMKYMFPARSAMTVRSFASGQSFKYPTADGTSMYLQIVSQGTDTNPLVNSQYAMAPVFGQVNFNECPVFSATIPISLEVLQDNVLGEQGLTALVSQLVGTAIGRTYDYSCVTGLGYNGSGSLSGGVLPAALNGVEATGSAVSSTLTYADILKLEGSIDPNYLNMPDCAFIMSNGTKFNLLGVNDNQGRPLFLNYLDPSQGKLIDQVHNHQLWLTPSMADNNSAANSGHNIFMVLAPFSHFLLRQVDEVKIVFNPWQMMSSRYVLLNVEHRFDCNYIGPSNSIAYLST